MHDISTSKQRAFASSLCGAYKLLRADFIFLNISRRVNLLPPDDSLDEYVDGSNFHHWDGAYYGGRYCRAVSSSLVSYSLE